MILELQRANRVSNPLNGVLLPVGKIVCRINRPLRASLMMDRVTDAIQDRVS